MFGEGSIVWFQNVSVGYLVHGYMYMLREVNLRYLVLEAEEREATCSWKHQLSHGGDTSECILNNQCHDAVCGRERVSEHVCVCVCV